MIKDFSLVVVSNRLPFVLKQGQDGSFSRQSSAGGLVTAVAPVVVQTDGYWVGWPGLPLDPGTAIPEASAKDNTPAGRLKSSKIIPVSMSEEEQVPARKTERPLRKPNPYVEFGLEWLRLLSWTAWILLFCWGISIVGLTYFSGLERAEVVEVPENSAESIVIPQESQDSTLAGSDEQPEG